MKRGLAFGVFDLFHVGHLRYLDFAGRHCDELWVAVRADSLVTPGKSHRPMYGENERREIIAALKPVDVAFVFTEVLENISYWRQWLTDNTIAIVIAGGDWKGTDRWNMLEHSLREIGIEILYAPRTDGISSTALR